MLLFGENNAMLECDFVGKQRERSAAAHGYDDRTSWRTVAVQSRLERQRQFWQPLNVIQQNLEVKAYCCNQNANGPPVAGDNDTSGQEPKTSGQRLICPANSAS